jgi:excisionase family DNA binding protein
MNVTLLSLNAAAKLLHLDYRTLKRAVVRGDCPAVKLGNRYRVEKRALERWVSGQRSLAPREIPMPPGVSDLPPDAGHVAVVTREERA